MKIKKQYDMLKKIKHSKEGLSSGEYFLNYLKDIFIIHLGNLGFFVSHLINKNMQGITFNIVAYTFSYFLYSLMAKKMKQKNIDNAEYDLLSLVNELSKLEVKTSVELLQEAKVNQIDYKIKYEDDDKIPRLVEYKYIDVPLSNGYEETLLQEHTYGDKDYELSVNSPVKKMEFKLAKQGI